MMLIWLVKQVNQPSYDEVAGFVIRADTEKRAREIASDNGLCEGRHTWKEPLLSTCTIIGVANIYDPEAMLLRDFRPG